MDVTRAAMYDRDGSISIREIELPQMNDGEALVRITACGICPGEAMDWYVARKAPFVLGHEPVGIVEAIGAGVDRLRKGDRVFIHHHAPCMTCKWCERGDYVQCETWRPARLVPGGMSERAVVQAQSVAVDMLTLPDAVDDDVATFVEPLATVVKSLDRAGDVRGRSVLVIGLGVMGLLHVMLAGRRDAALIIGVDGVDIRRAKALSIGAHAVFAPSEAVARVKEATGGGADVVVVGPGSTAAMDAAAASVAPGGTIVLFTPLPPGERWGIPVNDLFFKDVRITHSYSAGPGDTRKALELLENGLPVADLITHRLPLTDVRNAYDLVRDAGEALKVIVYPQRS
ncbi:MAG TPA: alcohol dehydrogenase catalytic domain-containing protein [Candidatus Eremiobacteraceae bacterium]|nr:alcohol dehydrogenase catalytic domain-containing protein [Candidatus Eremiobacteraceae bacterium]